MPREITYQAIIIKRQPYGEGDEILTMFTKENGKVRALAKASRMPKSKMRHALQTLFLVNLTVTSVSALPKIIRAETLESFRRIRDDLQAAKTAFYALELLLKFTADEHKNEKLFNLMQDFLKFLDSNQDHVAINFGLAKFKMEFLESIGLGIHYELHGHEPEEVGFSLNRGGFLADQRARDFQRINPTVYRLFLSLKGLSFDQLRNPDTIIRLKGDDIKALQDLLSSFIRYHLERDVNSERFLEE